MITSFCSLFRRAKGALEFRVQSVEAGRARRTDNLTAEKCSELDGRGVYRKSTGKEAGR